MPWHLTGVKVRPPRADEVQIEPSPGHIAPTSIPLIDEDFVPVPKATVCCVVIHDGFGHYLHTQPIELVPGGGEAMVNIPIPCPIDNIEGNALSITLQRVGQPDSVCTVSMDQLAGPDPQLGWLKEEERTPETAYRWTE